MHVMVAPTSKLVPTLQLLPLASLLLLLLLLLLHTLTMPSDVQTTSCCSLQ